MVEMEHHKRIMAHFAAASHREFNDYPDRHRLEYEIACRLGSPFLQRHFIILNSIYEAYEAVGRVLAFNPPSTCWVPDAPPDFTQYDGTGADSSEIATPTILVEDPESQKSVDLALHYCPKNRRPILKSTGSLRKWADHGNLTDVNVICLDEERHSQKIADLAELYPTSWLVIHSKAEIPHWPKLGSHVGSCSRAAIVLELPKFLKLPDDPCGAILIGSPTFIHHLQAFAFLFWYNMDLAHMLSLFHWIETTPVPLCRRSSFLAVLEYEAQRVTTKVRMHFNETRSQPTDHIFTRVKEKLLCSTYARSVDNARQAVAGHCAIPEDQILLSRGANEAIKRAFLALAGRGHYILLPEITYIAHVKAAFASGAHSIYSPVVSLDAGDPTALSWDLECFLSLAKRYKPRMVCLANPSNPLAEVLDAPVFHKLMEALRRSSPDTILVVDSCFHAYSTACGLRMPNYAEYMVDFPLIVVGSVSKDIGYAGARAGFMYGTKSLISEIKTCFSQQNEISFLGAATLEIIYSREESLRLRDETVRLNLKEQERIRSRILEIISRSAIAVTVSQSKPASFFLLGFPGTLIQSIMNWFRDRANIELSYVKRFHDVQRDALKVPFFEIVGCPEPFVLRVSPGTRQENDHFINWFEKFATRPRGSTIGSLDESTTAL